MSLCRMSFKLSVANNPIILSVVNLIVMMLNVVTLNVVMLNVVTVNVMMLNVVTLNVVILNVLAPFKGQVRWTKMTSP